MIRIPRLFWIYSDGGLHRRKVRPNSQDAFKATMDAKAAMFREVSKKQERLHGVKDPAKLAKVAKEFGVVIPDVGGGKKDEKKEGH